MNFLKHYPSFHIYLAGPIDYMKDRGVAYRKMLREKLLKIGIERSMILDPTEKPIRSEQYIDFDTEADYYKKLRENKEWDKFEEAMQMTMHVDLRFVDKSDVLLAFYNPEAPMFGTIHEIVVARQQKKPVLLIDPRGKEGTAHWAFGLIGHKHIFQNPDEAVKYLDDVLHNKVEIDQKEWLFLYTKDKKK